MLSITTLRAAHAALLHTERGIRPWAAMPDEQSATARAMLVEVRAACAEVAAEIRRREAPSLVPRTAAAA